MSYSLWPRDLCPRDFPGKYTGVGHHFLSPEDLPGLGIEPASPKLAGGFFSTESPGKPKSHIISKWKYIKCQNIFVPNRGARRKLEVCFYRGPRFFLSFSPSRSFVHCHLLPLFLFVQPPVPPLGPMTHFPSHPQPLDRHLSCLVFAEDRCQMRKLFEQLLSKSWPGIAQTGVSGYKLRSHQCCTVWGVLRSSPLQLFWAGFGDQESISSSQFSNHKIKDSQMRSLPVPHMAWGLWASGWGQASFARPSSLACWMSWFYRWFSKMETDVPSHRRWDLKKISMSEA